MANQQHLRRELASSHTYPIYSLIWMGDELVDWASGGRRFRLDGTVVMPRRGYAYHFDVALVSPGEKYVALYERLGTKVYSLMLVERYYVKSIVVTIMPMSMNIRLLFLTLPDGRIGIAHCPYDYEKIEIEEVETAQQRTSRDTPPFDFFHSRLAASSDSRYLLSAGWLWHPFDDMQVYDVPQVYAQPSLLDRPYEHKLTRTGVGINNAAFYDNRSILVTTNNVYYDSTDVDENEHILLEPDMLAVYDIENQQILHKVSLEEPAGTLMPLGEYVVGFYRHPKLIELKTGKIVGRWTDIFSGEQESSIISAAMNLPPIAIDREGKRFAVASQSSITVIQLGR